MSRRRRKNHQQKQDNSPSVRKCDYCDKEMGDQHPLAHWNSEHKFEDRNIITERVKDIHRLIPEMQRALKSGNRIHALLTCTKSLDLLHNISKILLIGIAAQDFGEAQMKAEPAPMIPIPPTPVPEKLAPNLYETEIYVAATCAEQPKEESREKMISTLVKEA